MKGSYTYQEVYRATLEYFKGDELAASTWSGKYAVKDTDGAYKELTPEDMHRRMAAEFFRIEKNYPEVGRESLSEYGSRREALTEHSIFELFKDFKYLIPQGSVMAALGNPYMVASLSNCVVLPEIFDSYGGIFYTDQQMAQLFKRRCGVGIDISTLRPEGQRVSNAAGSTSGAVSFMDRFSQTTREVAQHGRRGALMITMDVAHPDIEKFVSIKQDLSKVTGANISVRLSDEFMRAVESGSTFLLRWPIDSKNPVIKKEVSAKELWQLIIRCAHRTAEPGLIFWDRQHSYSTSSIYPGFRNVSTNPCSEIAMQGGDSCRLLAINLYSFVDEPFSDNSHFNFKKFYEVTYEAQRLMDDLVDLELEAIERILKKVNSDPEPDFIKDVELRTWELLKVTGKKGRRTGLGFTALADMLAALGLKFDSEDSFKVIEEMMRTKCQAEFDSTIDMAIERAPFESFDEKHERESEFIQMMQKEFPSVHQRMMKHGRRNISISTVAPTGSLSILAQTSSGIEPVFLPNYKRRRKIDPSQENIRVDFVDDMGDSWQEFDVYHPKLVEWIKRNSGRQVSESPYHGSSAAEIDWFQRVKLQSIVQKYVTHSISSTINLPADVSPEKVGEIYFEAWKQGLKGITVYRDGSRSGVLIAGEITEPSEILFKETIAPPRPQVLDSRIIRFYNEKEKWIAFVGLLENRPYEIFTGRAEDFRIPEYVKDGWIVKERGEEGSKRYDFQYRNTEGSLITIEGLSRSFDKEYWNYAKLISGVLRHGMPLPQVVELIGNLNLLSDSINTWKNGVERALKQFIPDGTAAHSKRCPQCGDPEGLIFEEGCVKCKSCSMNKCG